MALTAGHTGRDPSFDLGLQPTNVVHGELTARRKLPPDTPAARVSSETVPRACRPLDIGGGGPVNAQPALDGPMDPCHHGSPHFSRCYAMENPDRNSVYIAVSNSIA